MGESDTVYVRAGTYTEVEIVPPASGTTAEPCLISNYLSESVTVDCEALVGTDTTFIRFGTISRITVKGFTVTGFGNNFWGGAFFIGQSGTSSNIIIRDCIIHTDGYDEDNDNPAQLNMYDSDSCSIIKCTIYITNVDEGVGQGICGVKIWEDNLNTLVDSCEMYGLQSPGIFNKHGVNDQNLIVRNNYLHDNTSFVGDIHINFANSLVENNLIVSSKTGIVVWHAAGVHGGSGTTIQHNTIYGCSQGIILNDGSETQLVDVTVKDNIICYSSSTEFRDFNISPYSASTKIRKIVIFNY